MCFFGFQTATKFLEEIEERIKKTMGNGVNPLSVTGYVEAPLAYDAVWALALALDKAQRRFGPDRSSGRDTIVLHLSRAFL